MKNISIIFLFIFLSINVYGKITIPTVFSDNMVLQQNSDVAIWGWSEPGETIRLVTSWNIRDTISVKANNYAKWKTKIKTSSAGGPYTIEILGSSNILINNVMLGEVWLCSGQSNMEWAANFGLENKDEEIANANYPDIRILHVQRMGAESVQRDCYAKWEECTSESMGKTSAIAYFFARELNKKLDIPVGVIVSSWGGTPAEVWIKSELVDNNPVLSSALYSQITDWWPIKPGATYNSMIAPLIPYGIAGTLWYQGESNCPTYQVYSMMQKTLIENWRSDFEKEFPFYFVQIAPYEYGPNINSAYLREQQELTTKIVPNTGMIVISDLVSDVKDIHPKNKLDVGIRLANYALTETYHKNVGAFKSPTYKSMQIDKNKVTITFNDVISGLKCSGKSSLKFMISGMDRFFVPAKAKIDGKSIVVSSKKVKNPVAVRFCFDNTSIPDIFSSEGLPLAPFRSDNW